MLTLLSFTVVTKLKRTSRNVSTRTRGRAWAVTRAVGLSAMAQMVYANTESKTSLEQEAVQCSVLASIASNLPRAHERFVDQAGFWSFTASILHMKASGEAIGPTRVTEMRAPAFRKIEEMWKTRPDLAIEAMVRCEDWRTLVAKVSAPADATYEDLARMADGLPSPPAKQSPVALSNWQTTAQARSAFQSWEAADFPVPPVEWASSTAEEFRDDIIRLDAAVRARDIARVELAIKPVIAKLSRALAAAATLSDEKVAKDLSEALDDAEALLERARAGDWLDPQAPLFHHQSPLGK
jgi:hypothetical protein